MVKSVWGDDSSKDFNDLTEEAKPATKGELKGLELNQNFQLNKQAQRIKKLEETNEVLLAKVKHLETVIQTVTKQLTDQEEILSQISGL